MVPVKRALAIRGRLLGIGALAVLAGLANLTACGDPMLPADYQGPPAGAVGASVYGVELVSKVQRPQLSLEWLTNLDAPSGLNTLTGQPLRFARSPGLQTDWDIGLGVPIEGAKLERPIGPTAERVRLGVAKMVYYDDKNGDGRLLWSCRGIGCDQPKAVSNEFVVYVDPVALCALGSTPRGRLTAGYHYFRYEGGIASELLPGQNVSFILNDRSLAENDPSDELRAFARQLLGEWTRSVLAPCTD
jgi:hypothetical protein